MLDVDDIFGISDIPEDFKYSIRATSIPENYKSISTNPQNDIIQDAMYPEHIFRYRLKSADANSTDSKSESASHIAAGATSSYSIQNEVSTNYRNSHPNDNITTNPNTSDYATKELFFLAASAIIFGLVAHFAKRR